MFKLAFSTVGCPDWTLQRVARIAIDSNYEGVELRTFGGGSSILACDPALTTPTRTLDLFDDDGIDICGLAASTRFDAPVRPPVIGWALTDTERDVRDAKRHINLARALGAEYVRVFAFEPCPGERPSRAMGRIVRRLQLVCDHARHTGVFVALENGGGYPRAEQLAELIARVDSPLIGASYAVAPGAAAGDDPEQAVDMLADRLLTARVKDFKDGAPCLPGDGEIPCEAFVRALRRRAGSGWVVFEWAKLWLPDLTGDEDVFPAAEQRLGQWLYGGGSSGAGASEHRAPVAAN